MKVHVMSKNDSSLAICSLRTSARFESSVLIQHSHQNTHLSSSAVTSKHRQHGKLETHHRLDESEGEKVCFFARLAQRDVRPKRRMGSTWRRSQWFVLCGPFCTFASSLRTTGAKHQMTGRKRAWKVMNLYFLSGVFLAFLSKNPKDCPFRPVNDLFLFWVYLGCTDLNALFM